MHQFSGWLNIDKPKDFSSAKVVAVVRKLLNIKKVGHAGTLDPFATGVLPIAIGKATRTVEYMMDAGKGYEFLVQFGKQTDTDDIEGQVIKESAIIPTVQDVSNLIPNFIGNIEQLPPTYSALKINGQRAYKLAREKKEINLQPRKVTINKLELISFDQEKKQAKFKMECGKGTYVRSVARDIGIMLGCYAYVLELKRTFVGKFSINNAISLEILEKIVHNTPVENYLFAVDTVLDDIPAFEINTDNLGDLLNGKIISIGQSQNNFQQNSVIKATYNKNLIALGIYESGYFKPKKVFKLLGENDVDY